MVPEHHPLHFTGKRVVQAPSLLNLTEMQVFDLRKKTEQRWKLSDKLSFSQFLNHNSLLSL